MDNKRINVQCMVAYACTFKYQKNTSSFFNLVINFYTCHLYIQALYKSYLIYGSQTSIHFAFVYTTFMSTTAIIAIVKMMNNNKNRNNS